MFKIASTADYPEVFQSSRLDYVLTESELDFYRKIKGYNRKKGWVLKRLILKELASTFLEEKKKLWYPLNTVEVGAKDSENKFPVSVTMSDAGETRLMGCANIANNYGAGFITEYRDDLHIGLRLDQVRQEFPFSLEDRFTRDEERYIKAENSAEADKLVTIFTLVKAVVRDLLGADAEVPEITGVEADDTITLNPANMDMDFSFDDYIIRFWGYDDYIIVFVAFFMEPDRFLVEDGLRDWK